MKKVYIIGALIPTGGAFMAYHIGRLICQHYGYECVNVHIYDIDKTIFTYDIPMRTITPMDMEKEITPEDVMVVNPSFSQFLFGLRLPGRKIMYVQDFRTFLLLDCHCDLYVSVSSVVARYVEALYGIQTDIIPPFITHDTPTATPWQERPAGSALVYMKKPSMEHRILLRWLSERVPQIDLSYVVEGRGLSQTEFLQALGRVRYFVNMSLAEGFGLVPLEAMQMGTMVVGVDGLAGTDYMRSEHNSLTASIRDLRTLPAVVARAFADEALAFHCVEGGKKTASQFGYMPFKNAWLGQLEKLLGAPL